MALLPLVHQGGADFRLSAFLHVWGATLVAYRHAHVECLIRFYLLQQ